MARWLVAALMDRYCAAAAAGPPAQAAAAAAAAGDRASMTTAMAAGGDEASSGLRGWQQQEARQLAQHFAAASYGDALFGAAVALLLRRTVRLDVQASAGGGHWVGRCMIWLIECSAVNRAVPMPSSCHSPMLVAGGPVCPGRRAGAAPAAPAPPAARPARRLPGVAQRQRCQHLWPSLLRSRRSRRSRQCWQRRRQQQAAGVGLVSEAAERWAAGALPGGKQQQCGSGGRQQQRAGRRRQRVCSVFSRGASGAAPPGQRLLCGRRLQQHWAGPRACAAVQHSAAMRRWKHHSAAPAGHAAAVGRRCRRALGCTEPGQGGSYRGSMQRRKHRCRWRAGGGA